MDKNISLRKADICDINQIKSILFRALKEYEIEIPDNYAVSDIDSIEAKNNAEHVFVLLRNEVVIGFVVLKPITEDCIELKRLYLKSSERGQKLGKHLLDHAIRFAIRHKNTTIRLETSSKFKEAVSLYRKHGFRVLTEVEKAPGHDLALEKFL